MALSMQRRVPSFFLVLLVASTDALRLSSARSAKVPNKRSEPVPIGVQTAAAIGTMTALLPQSALASEDGGWALPALPALPTMPAWFDSKEAHDLGIFFAQTVISWGVPVAAIGALALIIGPFGKGGGNEGPRPLPPALAKALGMSNEPKEFLQIERLNEKLTSFEFSFRKASTSPASALRAKTKADIERQLGAEFQSFGLDALAVDGVFKAAATYRSAEEKVAKRLEAISAQLRAMTLAPGAAAASPGTGGEALSGKVVPTAGAVAAAAPAVAATAATAATEQTQPAPSSAPERSVVDKIMWGQKGPPAPADASPSATAAAAAPGMSMMPMFGGGGAAAALQPLLKEKAQLEQRQTQLELDFLRQLSTILSRDQASALMAVLKPVAEKGGPSISGAPASGPSRLDALGALVTAASAAAGRAKHVYVLKFFGDTTASQVGQLRQEVTAVLQTCDLDRGDEVVLVLNTGGGTVTGYGLAGAQLLRLKQAGLPLTICVEQVAASGGYLMACVADKIVAAPFAVLGSIGVITEIPNVYERLTKEGIAFSTVTAGKYKRTLTPTKKIEEADLAKTKDDIENVLKLFRGWVAENRPQVDIDEIATGETWLGPDALARKMVDELATVDDVLLGHVKAGAEVLGVTYKEAPKSPLAALAGAGASDGAVAPSVQALALAWLAQALGGGGRAGAAAAPLAELQALLQQQSRATQLGGALQMPNEPPPLAQRPTDAAEPMMLWGDEQDGTTPDSWYL